MSVEDIATLLHPAIAVFFVFPLIGAAVYFAWQTRQRRLQLAAGDKSKIPPIVGPDHFKLGKWLSASVVGITLLGMAQPIYKKLVLDSGNWAANSTRFYLILGFFIATIAALVFLYRAASLNPQTAWFWRALFASLTGLGMWVIGFQKFQAGDGNLYDLVFRRDFEWQVSHFYYGMIAAMLMIFSLAIAPDIYSRDKEKALTWRRVHTALNTIALLFFVGQALTGPRDLLEIPLSWQKSYVEQLYIQNCQTQPCQVQTAPAEEAPQGQATP
jgi:hypothetical protein